MSKLEKKFKEFIKTNYELISSLWITKQLIKDLAKIAEKENAELKKQIANIKYLDGGEVKKIISKNTYVDGLIISHYGYGTKENPVPGCYNKEGYKNMVTAICSLAIPITKEKIIEVLKDYYYEDEEDIKLFNQIASEILGEGNENK